MGFRGEALASIASIAKVTLDSKTADSYTGYEVVVEGGKILSKEEAGCANGTSITIENLFYNTPVRYKFLKKDFTESGYIEDVVTRIALVHLMPEFTGKVGGGVDVFGLGDQLVIRIHSSPYTFTI